MNKKSAFITVIAVFFIGMICGGIIVHLYHLSFEQRMYRGRQFMGRFMVERLDRELNLSKKQKEKILTILTQTRQEAMEELGRSRDSLHALFSESRTKIKEVLTPQQRARFEQIFKNAPPIRRRMFRRNQGNRRSGSSFHGKGRIHSPENNHN